MNISIRGLGGGCLAQNGHTVIGVDTVAPKVSLMHPEKIIIDLVRINVEHANGTYNGICW